MANHSFDIELTDEQKRLYLNSPTFRHGLDLLLRGFIPAFIRGLEVEAKDADIKHEQAIEASMLSVFTEEFTELRSVGFTSEVALHPNRPACPDCHHGTVGDCLCQRIGNNDG